MVEKINYSQLIPRDHKFTIVDTFSRDAQQSFSYPIPNFSNLIEVTKLSAHAGFEQETGGGDLPMTMLRNNQNPLRHQKKIKEAVESAKVKTEFLFRNMCVVGYDHQSTQDFELVAATIAENFDRARIFSHSNFIPSLYPAIDVMQKAGKEVQLDYSPSYVDGKSVWSDEQVVSYFQTAANLGVKRFGIKIFDGSMPPGDIHQMMKKLKEPGVMPEGSVFVCHTHDGHGIGKQQYEAFLAAGGDVIHCAHPAFGDNNSQPDISHFAEKYPDQINNLNLLEYSKYLTSGYKLAQKNNFVNKGLHEFFKGHAETFVKRINEKEHDYYKQLFHDKDIGEAVNQYTREITQAFMESTCPGGGFRNSYERAKKAMFVGDNVIPKFAKRDFLMDYFKTLKETKPKLGGNGYVTPNFKNADELAVSLVVNPNQKDPFTSQSGVSIKARKIFQGEFDPPMVPLDKEWLALVKSQDFDKELKVLKESGLIKNDHIVTELNGIKQAIVNASEAINSSYRMVRDYELYSKQLNSLGALYGNKKGGSNEYYKNQSKTLGRKLKPMGEKMEGEQQVTHGDYVELNRRGENGGKISDSINKIIETIPELKTVSGEAREYLGRLLRAVTFLECPAADVVPPKLEKVKKEYKTFASQTKLEQGKHLYNVQDAIVFRLLSSDTDPASPKMEQCFSGGSQALLAEKFADMESILKTSKPYKDFIRFQAKDGAIGIRNFLVEHGYGMEQSGAYSQQRLDEFIHTGFSGFASKDVIKYSNRYIEKVLLPNLDVEKLTGIPRLAGRNIGNRKVVEAKMTNLPVRDIWKQFKGIVSDFSDAMMSIVTQSENKKQITQGIENILARPGVRKEMEERIRNYYGYTTTGKKEFFDPASGSISEILEKRKNGNGTTNPTEKKEDSSQGRGL